MAASLPNVTIRRTPSDFVVEELPAYAPSGSGEHVYVTFQKTSLTTLDAVKHIAAALGVAPRDAGFAGMKDKHAITTQTASFQVPLAIDAASKLSPVSIPGIAIQSVSRHQNKLKPGHLLGNRFHIVLRDVALDSLDGLLQNLRSIAKTGIPNSFGPQRFGRDGDNPERALAWITGKTRGPRDKREQRLLFSALQSLWFNQVLDRRESEGTWSLILPGDLAKKTDTGGMFLVPLSGPECDEACARGAGDLSPTGPMFGKKMRWPEGKPAEIEREVLHAALPDISLLDAFSHLGEGTRRPLRMAVENLTCERRSDDEQAVAISFTLPKGGYATTVLGRVAELSDATVAQKGREQAPDPERSGDEATVLPLEDEGNG